MNDTLAAYLPPEALAFSWEAGHEFRILDAAEPGRPCNLKVETTTARTTQYVQAAMRHAGATEGDISTESLSMHCLHHFLKRGPVIVKPTLEMCRAFLDTEIRVPVREYKSPFAIMAVALPRAIVGIHFPCLTFVWRVLPNAVMAWTLSKLDSINYHTVFGDDLPTIEDRLALGEGIDNEADRGLLSVGNRIALNLCMVASFRKTAVAPLPKPVARNRLANNRQVRYEARLVPQELRFLDLVLKDRPGGEDAPGGLLGARQGHQRRRGHWRNVPFGPRAALRRYQWISEYETHRNEKGPDEPGPTTILR